MELQVSLLISKTLWCDRESKSVCLSKVCCNVSLAGLARGPQFSSDAKVSHIPVSRNQINTRTLALRSIHFTTPQSALLLGASFTFVAKGSVSSYRLSAPVIPLIALC